MTYLDKLAFASPWLLLAGLLFVPALFRELRRAGPGRSAPLAGIEYLRGRLQNNAAQRKYYRVALLAVLASMLAVLWAGPSMQSSQPLLAADQLARQKNLILAIDVSRSMSGPLELPAKDARFAAYGQAPTDAERKQTRYEAARDTVYRFVDRFPEARIGLILFSTEPFLARWPTTETDHRFIEVLEEDLHEVSQLRRFSGLTNTDAALGLAGDVFAALATSRGGAVIHISDAEDELENMGLAIRALRGADIRLYTIGVGIAESIVAKLSQDFSGDPGFRIFRVDSEQEMQEAYRLVAELEEAPRYAESEQAYVTDLRWLLALALAPFALFALWMLEMRLHRSEIAYPVTRRAG
ncbi:MAG: VWA domain-containing protein [Gammaproteobacteria bacterium]|nr:VWA domain-containing protein [Gammaproteobacteria bacterium]